jgi:hypothetical protein
MRTRHKVKQIDDLSLPAAAMSVNMRAGVVESLVSHHMQPIDRYFGAALQRKFARAIPRLRGQLALVPFSDHDATYGVGGETFRAFRNHRARPSEVYREWAAEVSKQLTPKQLTQQLQSREAFESWHRSLVGELSSRWKSRQGRTLSIAHRYKLVDLLIKWLSAHDFGQTKIIQGFEQYAHCALDRQTLKKLNECLSLALPITSPSMGDIHTEETYLFCQDLVAGFASSCGGTPLLFDYFAWKRGG